MLILWLQTQQWLLDYCERLVWVDYNNFSVPFKAYSLFHRMQNSGKVAVIKRLEYLDSEKLCTATPADLNLIEKEEKVTSPVIF